MPSITTEFIYYDGEVEFYKGGRLRVYRDDLPYLIKSELEDSKNVVCYELTWGSGPSLECLYIGIKNIVNV